MSSNESPYPPPEAVVERVTREVRALALNRYPDRDATALAEAIAARTGWPLDGLWIANGSNEVLLHLFLAFGGPGRSALVFEPTYPMHARIPRIASTEVVTVARGPDMLIDADAALRAIDRRAPEVVIVCSPNNPTGGAEPRSTIAALLDAAPGIVVVDEAYVEFAADGAGSLPLLASHENLVVTRTFSKAWRLAGVRIGYLMGSPSFVDALKGVRLPYQMSALTQVVGEAAIEHADETLEIVRAIAVERDRIADGLTQRGFRTFPSDANFVLFEVPDPGWLWSALRARGVLVRAYPEVPGLERCLRVTAGRPADTEAFLAALDGLSRG